jgi:signal transduction histidine kinase
MIHPSFLTLIRADFKASKRGLPGFCGKLLIPVAKLLGMSVSRDTKLRLPVFVAATVLIVTAIFLTALKAWQRIGDIQGQLTTVQMESFRIADHFHQSILDLNNSLLRYQLGPQPNEWDYFETRSAALNKWIDEQFGRLGDRITDRESQLLHELDAAFDVYLAAARKLEVAPPAEAASPSPRAPGDSLVQFASVKIETDKLLHLGIELATAHRETLNSLVERSVASLQFLRWILLGALLLLLIVGSGLGLIVFRDLIAPLRTKLVESHKLLERQEKLASLGMLAAGVAHEIRNPLTAIKARLFTQQKSLSPETPAYRDGQVIGHEIDRLDRIVKNVLTFARPSDPDLVTVAAHQPMLEVHSLMASKLNKFNIRLSVDRGVKALIRVDPQQIKQVLINLVQNAADSIGEDGSITLRVLADNVRLAEKTIPVVVLEVTDTGGGIQPDVEKRLFDPFFTTKDQGSGLGLPLAARIIEKHGGALRYQTRVGQGTTFGIVLPRISGRLE